MKASCSPTRPAFDAGARNTHTRSRGSAAAGLRPWQGVLTGLALSVSIGAQSYAATPSLEGRWTMLPAQSSFAEQVTGPAPDAVTVVVTRDDGKRLTYQLVESRDGAEVARGVYDISLSGRASVSSVDGAALDVSATREPDGAVLIRAPQVDGDQALIRISRTGEDGLRLQHEVATAGRTVDLETINLVRTPEVGSR